MNKPIIFLLLSAFTVTSLAQERNDKGIFRVSENEYFEQIQKAADLFNAEKKDSPKKFKMVQTGIDVPKSASEFKTVWAGNPISQGETNTCWSFSTISFYESEIYRLSKQEIKLSEAYIVYWQYVEKGREYVRTRGESAFDEGSETNAVMAMMRKYGAVPENEYPGIKPGQPFQDQRKMAEELKSYVQSVKSTNAWNETMVISTIKSIMNHYMGKPPETVGTGDVKISPQEYMSNVCKLNPDDYVDFMSLMEEPYWTQAEYKTSDNWWHSDDYYNVPLNDFVSIVKNAVKNGYSISIGGDVSESGINNYTGVMMIPSYDIPSKYIDENARQLRFSNGATTDDHAMHLVGYVEKSDGTWFLVKDSGSGGHNNVNSPGYYFMHEDYLKLKMMTLTLNKEAVKDYIGKFPDKKLVKFMK